MGHPPVKACRDDGKEKGIIPVCALGIERGRDGNGNRKPTDGNNPTDGEVSLQKVPTLRAAILTVSVDGADHREQDTPKCFETVPGAECRLSG